MEDKESCFLGKVLYKMRAYWQYPWLGGKGNTDLERSFLVLKVALQTILVTTFLWLIVKAETSITWQG